MALEYGKAFDSLTEKEKMYTYYLFKAIAAGWRVKLLKALLLLDYCNPSLQRVPLYCIASNSYF